MSKILTRKWIEVNYLSGGQCSVNKNIRFKTPMLRSDLCDYSDAHIVVKGINDVSERNKKLTFKNNAPFRSCVSKINNAFIDNAEDLDIVIPIYNLLEYNNNYSMTSGSLWNYYRHEANDAANEIVANCRLNTKKTTTIKSFEFKTKIIAGRPANNNTLDTEVLVLLKYLSNFPRFLDLLLINSEIELDLSWSKDCIIPEY